MLVGRTGDWTVSIVVDYEPECPDPPAVAEIDPEDTVGIDLGITAFIHDPDGRAVHAFDEKADRERIDRRHRDLSRKDRGSQNWERDTVVWHVPTSDSTTAEKTTARNSPTSIQHATTPYFSKT